jgi:polyhydroxybutyrate depolymerase
MTHRYSCERADRVAAAIALAGDDWKDATKCKPSSTVAMLQVHGDQDQSVPYLGSGATPSAHDSVAGWADKNGCAAMPTDTTQAPVDLEKNLPGAETTKEKWTGCKPGGAAELWTIHGGVHLPIWNQPAWPEAMWAWFAAHPKP